MYCQHSNVADSSQSQRHLTTNHFRTLLKSCECEAKAVTINMETNESFVKRLEDLESNECCDLNMKLITYQEWVASLLESNENLLRNTAKLEKEVKEHVHLMHKRPCNSTQYTGRSELQKCQEDIRSLVQAIKQAYYEKNWNISELKLHTLCKEEIFAVGDRLDPEIKTKFSFPSKKPIVSVRALAFEVAEKHDEILQLKRQVSKMEEDIQKAQQKIQLKDDVIKELRYDLRNAEMKNKCNQILEGSNDKRFDNTVTELQNENYFKELIMKWRDEFCAGHLSKTSVKTPDNVCDSCNLPLSNQSELQLMYEILHTMFNKSNETKSDNSSLTQQTNRES